jgi:TonB family protein
MTFVIRQLVLATALCSMTALGPTSLFAQKAEKSQRKKIYSVEPAYPEMLRRSNIGGVVRLLVVISPKGSVSTVNQLGGNAALVEAATSAVKKWKYAPAEVETTQEISLTFDPHNYQ